MFLATSYTQLELIEPKNELNLEFLEMLKSKKAFCRTYEVDQTMVNPEKNVTHHVHFQLLERIKFKFGKKYLFDFESRTLRGEIIEPQYSEMQYRKDFFLGEKITLKIWISEETENDFTMSFEYFCSNPKDIRARGFQKFTKNEKGENRKEISRPKKWIFVRYYKAIKSVLLYFTLLESFRKRIKAFFFLSRSFKRIKNGRYVYVRGIGFSQTNMQNWVRESKFPELLGDAREDFAKNCLMGFKEEVGKLYLLKTIDAHYCYLKHVPFGAEVEIRLKVVDVNRRFFVFKAEFINQETGGLAVVATQKIAYTNEKNKLVSLPKTLFSLLQGFKEFGK